MTWQIAMNSNGLICYTICSLLRLRQGKASSKRPRTAYCHGESCNEQSGVGPARGYTILLCFGRENRDTRFTTGVWGSLVLHVLPFINSKQMLSKSEQGSTGLFVHPALVSSNLRNPHFGSQWLFQERWNFFEMNASRTVPATEASLASNRTPPKVEPEVSASAPKQSCLSCFWSHVSTFITFGKV